MLRINAVLGILGTAAVLTALGQPLAQRALSPFVAPAAASADLAHSGRAMKGDRLASRPMQPVARIVPVSVEIVATSPLDLTMRARDGSVLYRVDGSLGTTSVARDGDLPAVTIRADGPSPASTAPSAQQVPVGPPPAPQRIIRVGCEGAVSALVSAEARRMIPGRCLA